MKEIDKDTAFTFANELADAAAKITLPLFRQSLDVSSKCRMALTLSPRLIKTLNKN